MARVARCRATVSVVIDCSIALSWCFEDEASAESDRLLAKVRNEGAVVPDLWHLELANVLLQAEKRGRITAADISVRLELIATLPIVTDHGAANRAAREILALARAHNLTAYDASYLELAMREGMALLTLDADLAAAAKKSGVVTLP